MADYCCIYDCHLQSAVDSLVQCYRSRLNVMCTATIT